MGQQNQVAAVAETIWLVKPKKAYKVFTVSIEKFANPWYSELL